MTTFKYDKLYRETPNALGDPSREFVRFFRNYPKEEARVLDLGCGQGRDALFIGRLGHEVIGVDLSQSGVAQLSDAAKREKLKITGVVADITHFQPEGLFDVVLADRTLHMLGRPERLIIFRRLLNRVAENGWLLVADEPRNIPDLRAILLEESENWRLEKSKRSFLFAQRSG